MDRLLFEPAHGAGVLDRLTKHSCLRTTAVYKGTRSGTKQVVDELSGQTMNPIHFTTRAASSGTHSKEESHPEHHFNEKHHAQPIFEDTMLQHTEDYHAYHPPYDDCASANNFYAHDYPQHPQSAVPLHMLHQPCYSLPDCPPPKRSFYIEGMKREGDAFTPDSESPGTCWSQSCSDAQECRDRNCGENCGEYYDIVECNEPSCAVGNSACGGEMPTAAVTAATYLQSAPLMNNGHDWFMENQNMDFNQSDFYNSGFNLWSDVDALHTTSNDMNTTSALPQPAVIGPYLGGEALEHRPKRRRGDESMDMDMSFSNQPMMNHPFNPEFNPSVAECRWKDCSQSFESLLGRDEHVHINHFHPQIKPTCPQNDCTGVSDNMNLSAHLKRSHDVMASEETCPFDDCEFNPYDGYVAIEQHVDQQHSTPARPLYCGWEGCDAKDLLAPVDLANHLNDKHEVRIYASEECKWKDEGSNVICGQRFQSPKELQDHTKTAHLASLSKKIGYICRWDGCERANKTAESKLAFAQRGKLERHMQSHTKYKACTCQVCGKDFSAGQALEQHMRTHNGDKPYVCKEPGCGKAFAQASALTMHNRTHTGEKPLKCDQCGKKFAESSNLSKHRKTHNAVGEYVCEEVGCEKSFHRPEQLRKHKEMHAKKSSGRRGVASKVVETEVVVA